jgi:hypothetical protein
MKKPLIFSGDSFTWGQGLELYDERFESYIKDVTKTWKRQSYNFPEVCMFTEGGTSLLKRNELAYPTLVSNYFDTIYFSPQGNGGSNKDSLRFISQVLDKIKSNLHLPEEIIFQMTSITRDMGDIIHDEMKSLLKFTDDRNDMKYKDYETYFFFTEMWERFDSTFNLPSSEGDFVKFNERSYFYKSNNYNPTSAELFPIKVGLQFQEYFKTADNFMNYCNNYILNYYIEVIKKFEKRIKKKIIIVGNWSQPDSDYIYDVKYKIDSNITKFYKDRTVPLHYKGGVWNTIADIINVGILREGLIFDADDRYKWTDDGHPTKELHKIIADSIITYIKNK